MSEDEQAQCDPHSDATAVSRAIKQVHELLAWQEEQKVLYAATSKAGVQLFVTIGGGYLVHSKMDADYRCMQPLEAICEYERRGGELLEG